MTAICVKKSVTASTPDTAPLTVTVPFMKPNIVKTIIRLPSNSAAVEKVGVKILYRGKLILPNFGGSNTDWITGDGSNPIVFEDLIQLEEGQKELTIQFYNSDTNDRIAHVEFQVESVHWLKTKRGEIIAGLLVDILNKLSVVEVENVEENNS
jgi:hypothetical protein